MEIVFETAQSKGNNAKQVHYQATRLEANLILRSPCHSLSSSQIPVATAKTSFQCTWNSVLRTSSVLGLNSQWHENQPASQPEAGSNQNRAGSQLGIIGRAGHPFVLAFVHYTTKLKALQPAGLTMTSAIVVPFLLILPWNRIAFPGRHACLHMYGTLHAKYQQPSSRNASEIGLNNKNQQIGKVLLDSLFLLFQAAIIVVSSHEELDLGDSENLCNKVDKQLVHDRFVNINRLRRNI